VNFHYRDHFPEKQSACVEEQRDLMQNLFETPDVMQNHKRALRMKEPIQFTSIAMPPIEQNCSAEIME
jgi:hypothetical protein